MKKILSVTKDFKIIPENFKNSGELEILEIVDDYIKARVLLEPKQNIEDYSEGVNVEVFGSNDLGLIYFETKIIKREDNVVYIKTVNDYSIIQRREYSRVLLKKGTVNFVDLAEDAVVSIDDISAGGMKFLSKENLTLEKQYKIEICLSNNMNINCAFQPVRINKIGNNFSISGKFVDLENLDRVVLVQYAFKIKMEEQNKDS